MGFWWKKLIYLAFIGAVLTLASNAPAGLVAHWKFDDATGNTAHDSSGSALHGTLQGNAQWVPGKIGGALQFDGVNAYVQAPYIPLNNRSFTIMMWVNAVLYTGEQVVFSQRQTSAANTDLHFRIGGPGSRNVPSGGVRMGFYKNDLDTPGGIIQENTWYHITFWYDFQSQNRRIYVNGVQEADAAATPYLGTSGNTVIGSWAGASQWFRGIIDDVRIYDRPLTAEQVEDLVLSGIEPEWTKAEKLNPPNGAQGVMQPLLQWKAGDKAAYHDVYFGTNPTPGQAEFKVRLAVSYTIYYDPVPLTPGTTYYWRIDEIEADGTTIHTGDVWSFTAATLTAYNPNPPEGGKWVDPHADLGWSAGAGAVKHDVYFGTSQADVGNGTGGTLRSTQQTAVTYEPGTLALDTTYYWRIDEYDSGGRKYPGAVWRFTTIGASAGIRGYYFNDMNVSGAPVLVRIDPTINFNWGDLGSPAPVVNVDQFSARWVGVVEAQYTEPYIFTCNTDDGFRMWLDDVLIIDSWVNQSPTMYSSAPINLVAGQRYGVRVEYYENGGGAVAQLFWQSPSTPRQIIPAGALQLPLMAGNPNPPNGAVDVKHTPTLKWTAGDGAVQHDVYFGTDPIAVADADATTPVIYRGRCDLCCYTPTEAPLEWAKTYYWRVDEVNDAEPDSPWKGSLWRFTTANYILVDDFEDYDDLCNRVFYNWIDGWGHVGDPGCGVPPAVGNGTGSAVGNANPPTVEQTIVHGGQQSMPFGYNNGLSPFYSEASRQWASPQDWTCRDVRGLSLCFHGHPGNAPDTLYLVLEDSAAELAVVTHPDPEALQGAGWQQWNIDLQQLSSLDLASIKKIYLGIGNRNSPQAGGSGKLYFDDIRVYPARCVPSLAKPEADLSGNCIVDYADVQIVAGQWLNAEFLITPVDPGTSDLVAHYRFEGDANDAVGGHNGVTSDIVSYGTGKVGQAITLDGVNDYVVVGPVGINGDAPRTISGWAKAHATVMPDWTNVFGFTDPGGGAAKSFDIEYTGVTGATYRGYGIHVYGWQRNMFPVDLEWHHLAATYDEITVRWYGDGRLVGSADLDLDTIDNLQMGKRADYENYFPGRIDEVYIFTRALSEAEIAWLAGYTSPFSIPADLHQDDVIDFKDFAVLADSWLDQLFWP